MKNLIIILEPITQKYKGHKSELQEICRQIALYNGGNYGNPDERDIKSTDKFIEDLFDDSKITTSKENDSTTNFGHHKISEYVHYGKIIKTALI